MQLSSPRLATKAGRDSDVAIDGLSEESVHLSVGSQVPEGVEVDHVIGHVVGPLQLLWSDVVKMQARLSYKGQTALYEGRTSVWHA